MAERRLGIRRPVATKWNWLFQVTPSPFLERPLEKESPMHRGAPRRMKIVLFSKESPMHRGAPRRMKIGLFSREVEV
ncbi:hypothetical protein [Candidatus Hakubella thermalkaliphila]|uniref:hypothetical protein n=1 Tax=Candidatus Hakubella thermalkaliphila TaxID=2754717 RepID=UPI001593B634|nr:hypothetical protein [Candidatus Hakubella thermalkaliphila]